MRNWAAGLLFVLLGSWLFVTYKYSWSSFNALITVTQTNPETGNLMSLLNVKRVDEIDQTTEKDEHEDPYPDTPNTVENMSTSTVAGLEREKKKKIKILILTYMRSGSTFLGSMFGVNSDVFYVFEPIRSLTLRVPRQSGILHYLDGTTRPLDFNNDKVQTINDLSNCQLQSLSSEVMTNLFWRESTHGNKYQNCIGTDPTIQEITNCLSILTNPCSRRSAVAIKTIRTSMKNAETFIQKDQSWKVIHLIRDPRSMLSSHLKWNYVKRENLDAYSLKLCKTMSEDIAVREKINSTYPDTIKLVQYEDLTVDAFNIVKSIYDFLKMPFTEEITDNIKKLSSKEETNCFLCTGRSNATHQLLKWRTSINYTDVEIIDKNCGDVYKSLGYLPASSEDILRNLSHPLRIKLT